MHVYAQSYHDLHLACFRAVSLLIKIFVLQYLIHVAQKGKHLFHNL